MSKNVNNYNFISERIRMDIFSIYFTEQGNLDVFLFLFSIESPARDDHTVVYEIKGSLPQIHCVTNGFPLTYAACGIINF